MWGTRKPERIIYRQIYLNQYNAFSCTVHQQREDNLIYNLPHKKVLPFSHFKKNTLVTVLHFTDLKSINLN